MFPNTYLFIIFPVNKISVLLQEKCVLQNCISSAGIVVRQPLTWIFHAREGFIGKALKGAAGMLYCKP